MKISSPPPWPCGRSRRTVVKFLMLGFRDLDVSLDSCIAATLRYVSPESVPTLIACYQFRSR